jgi:hypothetical protein
MISQREDRSRSSKKRVVTTCGWLDRRSGSNTRQRSGVSTWSITCLPCDGSKSRATSANSTSSCSSLCLTRASSTRSSMGCRGWLHGTSPIGECMVCQTSSRSMACLLRGHTERECRCSRVSLPMSSDARSFEKGRTKLTSFEHSEPTRQVNLRLG